jgi:DNA-binding NarL/FixJ family response regulator
MVVWQNMSMPPTSRYEIVLTEDERAALVALTRPTAQARQVLRARIVLGAAQGDSNAAIARDVGVCEDTVRKWRSRFAARRVAGLADA